MHRVRQGLALWICWVGVTTVIGMVTMPIATVVEHSTHQFLPMFLPAYPAGWSGSVAHLALPASRVRLVGGSECCWSHSSFFRISTALPGSPRMGRAGCLANFSAGESSYSLRWDVGRRTSSWRPRAICIRCNQMAADQYCSLGYRLAFRHARGKYHQYEGGLNPSRHAPWRHDLGDSGSHHWCWSSRTLE